MGCGLELRKLFKVLNVTQCRLNVNVLLKGMSPNILKEKFENIL